MTDVCVGAALTMGGPLGLVFGATRDLILIVAVFLLFVGLLYIAVAASLVVNPSQSPDAGVMAAVGATCGFWWAVIGGQRSTSASNRRSKEA